MVCDGVYTGEDDTDPPPEQGPEVKVGSAQKLRQGPVLSDV